MELGPQGRVQSLLGIDRHEAAKMKTYVEAS